MTDFQVKFLVACEVVALVVTCSGCGDNSPHEPGAPYLDVACGAPVGEPRCFIEALDADSVDAFYGDRLAWYDRDIVEWRVVYIDSPPQGDLTVEACNDAGCAAVEYLATPGGL